jgi:hypothetical protein
MADRPAPYCIPARSIALASPINPWAAPSFAGFLRDAAIALHRDDFEAAFRAWCDYARGTVRWPGFRRWSTDFRRRDDAETLRVLAALDVDDFFRRHPLSPPKGDGGFEPPSLAPDLPEPELIDA